ncbi:hypothetical protein LXL04_023419 [Taraxacum kok-saghyz]
MEQQSEIGPHSSNQSDNDILYGFSMIGLNNNIKNGSLSITHIPALDFQYDFSCGYIASFEILYSTILEAMLKLDAKIKEATPANSEMLFQSKGMERKCIALFGDLSNVYFRYYLVPPPWKFDAIFDITIIY